MQLLIFRSIGKFVVDWLLVVVKTFLNIYKYLVLGAVKEKHFTVTASLRASSAPPPPSTARHGPRPGVRPVVTGVSSAQCVWSVTAAVMLCTRQVFRACAVRTAPPSPAHAH